MTIIVHFTDNNQASWLDGPFRGKGHCYRNYQVSPPRDGYQVIAPPTITLSQLRDAVDWVDEDTALRNLEKLGCDLQTTPPDFTRRASDRR